MDDGLLTIRKVPHLPQIGKEGSLIAEFTKRVVKRSGEVCNVVKALKKLAKVLAKELTITSFCFFRLLSTENFKKWLSSQIGHNVVESHDLIIN